MQRLIAKALGNVVILSPVGAQSLDAFRTRGLINVTFREYKPCRVDSMLLLEARCNIHRKGYTFKLRVDLFRVKKLFHCRASCLQGLRPRIMREPYFIVLIRFVEK